MKKYLLFAILLTCPYYANASEFIQQSEFDVAHSKIKYSLLSNQISKEKFKDSDDITYNGSTSTQNADYKSPGKAFAMSLILPGWGQHYTGGSKLKSLAFFGTEVTSWVLYFKFDRDGNDLTNEFETFNDVHWSETRYDTLLLWTYPDRDANPGLYPEMSHHLPDTKTQQYYEMTGKYDQFSWGWDDAILLSDSSVFENYTANNPFTRVNIPVTVPYSANRLAYEKMRDDANNKFDQARKMVLVSMLNRLLSGFEAMIAAKKYNKNSTGVSALSSLSAKASFKSYYVKRDTPFLTLSMKF